MSFASFGFLLVFLPAALLGFRVAAALGPAAAMAWLILCSLAFYPAEHLPVLFLSLLANALIGHRIRSAEDRPRAQALWLSLGIAANLAGLAAGRSLGSVPPGLSFVAFTQIGWLLDQRGAPAGARRFLHYPLLVLFFPHLIAGPILRVRDVEAPFADPATWRVSAGNLAAGSAFFLIGLLKKTLLANPLGALVAPGFDDPATLGVLAAWGAALAWSFQLYFDFSGYSDMAVGLGRMFGVRMPVNFASPYKAQSVIDYWQRWHITLTRFLLSTVYNPLTMAAMRWRRRRHRAVDRSAQRTCGGFATMLLGPLTVTMGLAGLWHGVTLPYLAFGLLHAGFLGVNHAWRVFRPESRSQAWHAVACRVALTYLCVLPASVIFRAPTLDTAGGVFAGMLGRHAGTPDAHAGVHALWLAGLAIIVWGLPNTQEIVEGGAIWPRWRPTLPWAVAAGCAAALGLLSLGGTHEFVYFQF